MWCTLRVYETPAGEVFEVSTHRWLGHLQHPGKLPNGQLLASEQAHHARAGGFTQKLKMVEDFGGHVGLDEAEGAILHEVVDRACCSFVYSDTRMKSPGKSGSYRTPFHAELS